MLFKEIAPGDRIVLGVADSVPPNAVFDRLRRIADRVDREGRLPLKAGTFRPLPSAAPAEKTSASPGTPALAAELASVYQGVLDGDADAVARRIDELLNGGTGAGAILDAMIAAMETIGNLFKEQEVFIPEVLLAARAMNAGLALLEPHLASPGAGGRARAKMLLGTVAGDMHDIGKNMVATMFRGAGFEVMDLGINVTADEFARVADEYKPRILGLSALLTTTMPEMKKVIDALREKGLRDGLKILVGGAPLNEKFARDIGADGYAPNASDAVRTARAMLGAG
ncbi:MAG: cobalamin-binding protein [Spirochaetes bacterium]|nr:MAG: cobalamin-binding protein [Spirochaetota bacterium]